MSHIVFTAFADRADAIDLAHQTADLLAEQGTASSVHLLDDANHPELDRHSLIVSLGGDGTFLKSARLAHASGARVLPIHLGRVGFLLDAPTGELVTSISDALTTDKSEERMALRVTLADGRSDFALNEVVLERSAPGQMVHVTTFVDDEEFLTYAADGVLVATPTGSTAYNFSAGGPIVDPSLQVVVVTPVAPHFTIDRSIVVSSSSVIRLTTKLRPTTVLADSNVAGLLEPGDSVVVTKSSTPVRVVRSRSFEMGYRLRQSLREGHA